MRCGHATGSKENRVLVSKFRFEGSLDGDRSLHVVSDHEHLGARAGGVCRVGRYPGVVVNARIERYPNRLLRRGAGDGSAASARFGCSAAQRRWAAFSAAVSGHRVSKRESKPGSVGLSRSPLPTDEMEWDMHYLVADIARNITLEPGDLLLSGTPANSRPVEPGDVVAVEVEGLGRLENEIVHGPAPVRDDVGAQPTSSEEVVSTALGGDWEFRGIRAPRGPGAKHYQSRGGGVRGYPSRSWSMPSASRKLRMTLSVHRETGVEELVLDVT